MTPTDLVVTPNPLPKLLNYPATLGIAIGCILTIILLLVSGKYDKTQGVLTISLLVVLAFIALVTYSALFTIPNDEITSGIIGGLIAAFGAIIAHWIGKDKSKPPE